MTQSCSKTFKWLEDLTAHVTLKGSVLEGKSPLFQGNPGWWNIMIWPDISLYIYLILITTSKRSCLRIYNTLCTFRKKINRRWVLLWHVASHQWSTPKRSFSYSAIDFRTCTQNYVVPLERSLGTTHLFFFQRLLYRWGEFFMPPKKNPPTFFLGTRKHTHTTSQVSVSTQPRFEGMDPRVLVGSHGNVSTTLRIAARLRGMYIFRCEENSFLAPRDENFHFCQKKGKAHRKTLRCNYTTPRKERHFFLRENQWWFC